LDYKGRSVNFKNQLPVAGLLTGATIWGLIWYPYRALEHAGIGGELATTLTYAMALTLGVALFRPRPEASQLSWMLVPIALSAGWANVGFTLAVIHGDVMRVVLLFYLAPVWTVLFARLLLGEKLTVAGYGLMLLAISGAATMLWRPQAGWPVPRVSAEWIALSAGAMFALSNVLARKTAGVAIEFKVLAVFAGCVAMGAVSLLFANATTGIRARMEEQGLLLLVLAIVLLSVNLAVQYGLTRVSANRAIVIYLFELVVTAVSAWLLVDELLSLREWCGGAMIVGAGLMSGRCGAVASKSDGAVSEYSFVPGERPD
jgi:drug/metabolite transporter (DMT)-like permease